MSTSSNEETPAAAVTDDAGETKTPRKRAAKKAATKTAAKKTTTKKTARKAAAKKAAKTADDAPAAPAPAPVETVRAVVESPAKKAPRARKSAKAAAEAQDQPPPVSEPQPQAAPEPVGGQRKFGRVPGGGPRVLRENPPVSVETQPQPQPEQRQAHHHPQQGGKNQQQGGQRESRSKRRRDKRKRRAQMQREGREGGGDFHQPAGESQPNRPAAPNGPKTKVDGMLELAPKGFGFLRVAGKNFEQARDDIFVTPEIIRKYNLRLGQWIHGLHQEGPRGPQLVEITAVNGMPPEEAAKLPHFDELKAINPAKRISFETTPERFTTRVVDIMAPVGRGQRGLIVSPPRSGKTTLLLHMAEAIREKYDEAIHLMVLLVDERPEEVTEFRRALPGAEIYASSNDEQARSHCRIAELAIERAKRLVEAGKDVFLLMDSITRLARAYNNTMNNRGRGTGSGGITIGALEVPRRLFAAARNTRGGGSLTILATALIQTNSRADEAIFMEFKGTGNMELVLDRKIAENYIYPAVDIFKSGTRREELLIPGHMLHKIHLIRRGLSGHRPVEAMERLLFFLKKFPNNPQMLLEIKG